jgi:uncharacterized protein (DUF885 family)
MGLKHLCIFALTLLAAPLAAEDAAPRAATQIGNTEDTKLLDLFEASERREAALDPLGRLYIGEAPDPKLLAKAYTDENDRKRLAAARETLAALRRIDRVKLSPERQISYDSFLHDLREGAAWLQPDVRALDAVRPFNHFGGTHLELPGLLARNGGLRYDSEADYRRNLALLRAIPAVLDNAVLRFREGLASGVTEPRRSVEIMVEQLDGLLAQPLEETAFLSPVRDFPDGVPDERRAHLASAWRASVTAEVLPAYRRLRAFLAEEYLPAARTSTGLGEMKGGAELYRLLIARHTTLPLDPEAIHRLGLSEVARIQQEMDGVRRELGDKGDLRTFFEKIRADPRFHPKSAQELAEGFGAVARKVDALAPQYFKRMPRTPLLIQPYPEYRARFEAGGSYNQGSSDRRRPGIFFFNTYDLPSRFTSGIATLYLHEGAPGHHFQVSLAQEDTSLPAFQRFGGNNAFVEGWALYAETLGYPMGFYDDPLQHWGTLDDEMLRAMRLVVDTGLHTRGWSRDRAIRYMLDNSGMGRSDAEAEVDRYIANPGQALSYKIGALTIQRLRREAEAALGTRFDVREFHDQVLGSGAVPLGVLEGKVRRWIAASTRGTRSP